MFPARVKPLALMKAGLQAQTAIALGLFAISFHVVWAVIGFWCVFIYLQVLDLEKTPMFEDARG